MKPVVATLSDAEHTFPETPEALVEARLGSFYGCYFGLVGVRTTLLPLWLRTVCALQAPQIGAVLSTMQLCSVPAGPLFGLLADKIGRTRAVLLGLTMTASLTSLSLVVVMMVARSTSSLPPFPVLLALVALSSALFSACLPLQESLSQSALGPGSAKYGRVRLWGSLGFMITSTLIGQAAAQYGNWIILNAFAGFMALTAFAAFLQPISQRSPQNKSSTPSTSEVPLTTKRKSGIPVGKLFRNPVFLLGVCTAGLLQASHAMYYGFGTISFSLAGYSGGTIGLLWSLGVAAEILLFAATSAIKKSLHPPLLLLLGGLAGILRWSCLGVLSLLSSPTSPLPPAAGLQSLGSAAAAAGVAAAGVGGTPLPVLPLPILMVSQLLHGLTFGAVHLAAVGFLGRAAPHNLRSSAQGIYGAISDGGFMASMMMLSVYLFNKYQTMAFISMSLVSFIGCIGSLALWKSWDGKELQL